MQITSKVQRGFFPKSLLNRSVFAITEHISAIQRTNRIQLMLLTNSNQAAQTALMSPTSLQKGGQSQEACKAAATAQAMQRWHWKVGWTQGSPALEGICIPSAMDHQRLRVDKPLHWFRSASTCIRFARLRNLQNLTATWTGVWLIGLIITVAIPRPGQRLRRVQINDAIPKLAFRPSDLTFHLYLLCWGTRWVPKKISFLAASKTFMVMALVHALVTCLCRRQWGSWSRRTWHWSQHTRPCAIWVEKLASDGLQNLNKAPHGCRDDVPWVEDCRPLCCPSMPRQNSKMLAWHTMLCTPRQARGFEWVRSQLPGTNCPAWTFEQLVNELVELLWSQVTLAPTTCNSTWSRKHWQWVGSRQSEAHTLSQFDVILSPVTTTHSFGCSYNRQQLSFGVHVASALVNGCTHFQEGAIFVQESIGDCEQVWMSCPGI